MNESSTELSDYLSVPQFPGDGEVHEDHRSWMWPYVYVLAKKLSALHDAIMETLEQLPGDERCRFELKQAKTNM